MTSAKRDYYELLGVDRNADDETIKTAYRRLAMRHHPDRNPGDEQAAERMKEINEAYAVLGNPQKRGEYDLHGHTGLEGYTQEDLFRGVDFASIFEELGLGRPFGFGDSFFGTFFGGRAATRRERGKGADLRYDVDATLEEVATGIAKTIQVPHEKPCPDCHGTGAQGGVTEECQRCGGTGQLNRSQGGIYIKCS
jgi:molecular chaperone DnaJ